MRLVSVLLGLLAVVSFFAAGIVLRPSTPAFDGELGIQVLGLEAVAWSAALLVGCRCLVELADSLS